MMGDSYYIILLVSVVGVLMLAGIVSQKENAGLSDHHLHYHHECISYPQGTDDEKPTD